MTDYFKRLFEYNHWANGLLIENLGKLPAPPPKSLDRMSHIVLVEFIWRARVEGKVFTEDSSTTRPLDEVTRLNDGSFNLWLAFLERLAPEKYTEVIAYKTMAGKAMETRLSEILAHVINHGTHHRGQVVASIRDAGFEPPSLDLVYFTRT